MKLVIAVIQPTKLRALKQALTQIGVKRITICDSQEFAGRADREPVYRGMKYRTDVLRKLTLEIAVNDDFIDKTIETIAQVARTGTLGEEGNEGDGKIFVMHIQDAIAYHPETRGQGAV